MITREDLQQTYQKGRLSTWKPQDAQSIFRNWKSPIRNVLKTDSHQKASRAGERLLREAGLVVIESVLPTRLDSGT